MFSGTPDLRQWKLVVAVYDRRNCLIELVFGDVPLINKRHLPPIQSADRARGLGRAEIEAVAEGGHKVTLSWIIEFAVVPGDRSKVPRPMQPLLRIRENIENANRSHPVLQIAFERPQANWIWRTA